MWNIWKYKCTIVFDKVQVNLQNIIALVQKNIVEWESFIDTSTIQRSHIVKTPECWKCPQSGWKKINAYASFDKNANNNIAGIGLMLRNCVGTLEAAKGSTVAAMDEEQAEALACLEAVEWAIAKEIQQLHLEYDNINIVSAINGSLSSISWTSSNVVQDCLVRLNSINKWVCTSVKRSANSCADTLAKNARLHSKIGEWSVAPMFMLEDLDKDANAVTV
ncbi:uncharacterized protein LOC113348308 [Papaver somniferum]|uniref:uncharacterized protein LOC113348308 n=1 Tax=Papaver somniferum TaxID=3469 RepID=UPI000E6F5490|nr:uncharacterized protein LOC113348308 [Papaver somniferum]